MASSSSSSSSSAKRARPKGHWWDPNARPSDLVVRFGPSFDITLCPGLKVTDSPEMKATAYIQSGLGSGFFDNEECTGEPVLSHATNVPASAGPPSWAVLDPRGTFFCGNEEDRPSARWRGTYFSLSALSLNTDHEKHWVICLHPGCGAKVAGFSNWNNQHKPRHPAWTFSTDEHPAAWRAVESILKPSSMMVAQPLFNAMAKVPVRPKTKTEVADLLALYHARTPGTSYEALGGDAMHALLSGVTGLGSKALPLPRRGMISKAHHRLFQQQHEMVLSEVKASLEEGRRLRLSHIDGSAIEDSAVQYPRFALSTDGGSQGKQNFLHISLFLMVNGVIKEWALELAPFAHPHTAERYFEVLEDTVSSVLGVHSRGFFTSDNCESSLFFFPAPAHCHSHTFSHTSTHSL
jgi:hypothetical protein